MKILHLTLKKKWFDLIIQGVKKEEYRELKPYWSARLVKNIKGDWKEYDIIRFRNGYSKTSPTFDIEFKGVRLGNGVIDWGAEKGQLYYVISLGKILNV